MLPLFHTRKNLTKVNKYTRKKYKKVYFKMNILVTTDVRVSKKFLKLVNNVMKNKTPL